MNEGSHELLWGILGIDDEHDWGRPRNARAIVAMLTRLTNRFHRDNALPSSGRILQALFLSVCFENQRCQVPIVLDSLDENRHSGADQN